MQAHTKHRNRAPVAIVGWIDDQLIVQRDPRGKPGKAVIRLEDSLIAGMRQLAVADQDAKSAGIEESLMHAGDAVDDAGDANGVIVPSPLPPGNRESSRQGPVDVCE